MENSRRTLMLAKVCPVKLRELADWIENDGPGWPLPALKGIDRLTKSIERIVDEPDNINHVTTECDISRRA